MGHAVKAPIDPVIGALQGFTPTPLAPLVVAFSGGLDSTVLLHAAVARWGPACVVAAHVDHQLQAASSQWDAHCRQQAKALGVRFEGCKLEPRELPRHPEVSHLDSHALLIHPDVARRGMEEGIHEGTNLHEATNLREASNLREATNIEAWARQARYDALTRIARACNASALATAHHADDQLETLLMALARGAGLDGLTGIAAQTERGGVTLLRPLIELPRSALHAWARQHELQWVEDPMNAWPQLRRTAIRQRLTPVLDEVLPGLRRHLPQALASLRESREALDESTRLELAALRVAPRALHALDRDALSAWPEARQRRVLRAWLASLGLAMPTRARLQEIRSQCLVAASAHAHLLHESWHIVRQGRRLLAWPDSLHPRWVAPDEPLALPSWCDQGLALPDGTWLRACGAVAPMGGARRGQCGEPGEPGEPGEASGTGESSEGSERVERVEGLSPDWLRSASFRLVRPESSMRVRLRESGPSRELRKLWQEAGLPVSVRASCPLILANGSPFWLMPFGPLAGPWPKLQGGLALRWETPVGDPRVIGA